MANPQVDAVLDILKQGGGNIDIQTYPVGLGGLTRVNVQPAVVYSYDTTPTVWGVLMGFLSGTLIVGVGTLVLAVAIVAALVMFSVISLNGLTVGLLTTIFFWWAGVSLLSGVVVAVYGLGG